MSVERNLLISTLKLTKNGSALIKDVNIDARIPSAISHQLLQTLQKQELIYLDNESITLDSNSRLKLAVRAVTLGADIQSISGLLCWQEFEEIAVYALKINGYIVERNVRFKQDGRRWEIDVVGCKKPLVICIDCKHWGKAITPSALSRIVDEQVARTKAFSETLPNPKLKVACTSWETALFVPAVLSLIQSAYKYVHEVPIVPVLKLQDFISQLPLHTQDVHSFSRKFTPLSHKFKD